MKCSDLSESTPLKDLSGGRLKGWPGGEAWLPNGVTRPTFRPAKQEDVVHVWVTRSRGCGRWIYCDYCYKHALPLTLCELYEWKQTEMQICSACGAGLTSPESKTVAGVK